MNDFDAYSCPLDGINLVEAGAGTGKTYNIQILLARLVLEKAIPIEKILVVTFTRAATAELQERVRAILMALNQAVNDQKPSPDEQDRCDKILARLPNLPPAEPFWDDENYSKVPASQIAPWQGRAALLLGRALRDFDQAAISTIHSFCQRMLTENAFESGIRYGMELRTDTREITGALVQQFIRKEFYAGDGRAMAVWDALDMDWQQIKKDDLPADDSFIPKNKNFADAVLGALGRPGIINYWGVEPGKEKDLPSRDTLLTEIAAAMATLRGMKDERKAFFDTLSNCIKGDTKKKIVAFAALLDQDGVVFPLNDAETLIKISMLSREQLITCSYVGKSSEIEAALGLPANQALLADFARLVELLRLYRSRCFIDALAYVETELSAQKSRDGFMTYEDLLNELAWRLGDDDHGLALQARIRELFPYALVDEFQDTDPVQFQIFHQIFAGAGATGGFFMIGDPKQAIYGFRGGDIYTYLEACSQVPPERKYTLRTNYRASESFIAALNAFYGYNQPCPFAHEDMVCPETLSPAPNLCALYKDGKAYDQPLQFNAVPDKTDVTAVAVAKIKDMLADGSWEIAGKDGGRQALKRSDFAVLCRTNDNAAKFEKALRKAGVPSVRIGVSNVMVSEAAACVGDLLAVLNDPADSRLLVKLLASPLYAFTAREIYDLKNSQDPEQSLTAYQDCLSQFSAQWDKRSFSWMVQSLLADKRQDILCTLVSQPDGERLLTDFLHIMELLSRAEDENGFGKEALIAYYEQQRLMGKDGDDTGGEDSEQLIRLATERNAVILSTVHVSKGLEYPIVFLPDLHTGSGGGQNNRPNITCHVDIAGRMRALRDVTNIGTYKSLCDLETLQEKLRQFYVAITRAKVFCAVFMKDHEKTLSQAIFKYIFRKRGNDQLPPTGRDKLVEWFDKIIAVDWEMAATEAHGLCVNMITPDAAQSTPTPPAAVSPAQKSAPAAAQPTPTPPAVASPASTPPVLVRSIFSSASGLVAPFWTTISASSLIGRIHAAADQGERTRVASQANVTAGSDQDYDDADNGGGGALDAAAKKKMTAEEWAALPMIFTFSRGKKAGICWHSVFEVIDFQAKDADLREVARDKLSLYSLLQSDDELDAFVGMVRQVLNAPLQPEVGGSFRFADVALADRLSELHFDYCLPARSELVLPAELLKRYDLPVDYDVKTDAIRALTGSIDLVLRHDGRYYIVDWKSNVIDYDIANFSGEGLRAEMIKHAYGMQYLVYTVALAEYIDDRLGHFTQEDYDSLFGGVFYIFLRGVDAAVPGQGVFHKRPAFADIKQLREVIGRNKASR